MSEAAPQLLFAPYYNRGGSTEFVRAVLLARACARRWPAAGIEFVLPGGAETRDDCPFPAVFNDDHLEYPPRIAFLCRHIERRRPQLAIFDGWCDPLVLDACRRAGVRSAYVADQLSMRRRAFKRGWLRRLDAHWQQRHDLTQPAFTPMQRLLSRVSSTRRAVYDVYYDDTPFDFARLPDPLRARIERPFALWVPGGGGYRIDGRYAGELFHAAAEALHVARGLDSVSLLGPLHVGALPQGRTLALRALEPAAVVALMRRATLVICNGASGALHQALACGAAVVATPLGGVDQPPRIAAYAAAGLIRAAAPDAAALAAACAAALTDGGAALRSRAAALQLVNGIPLMVDRIAELLALAGRQTLRCDGPELA